MIKKKIYYLLLVCSLNSYYHVLAQTTQVALNSFVNYQGFVGASLGIYAIDVASNNIIMQYDKDRLLTPASTAKLFSTAFALNNLNDNYRPSTSLYYNGTIQDSVLTGDIWIIGEGDMTLGSDDKGAFLSLWTEQIRLAGMKTINGTIYADGSNFGYQDPPQDWQWGDIGNYYGTHFSGLMIYRNAIEYHFKTNKDGTPAQLLYTIPQIDPLKFKNYIVASTKKGDNSIIFGTPYSYIREGYGTIPEHSSDFIVKGSIPHPEQQLLSELKRQLDKDSIQHNGELIAIKDKPTPRPTNTWIKIIEHYGKTIREIASITNYNSVNVFAEGLMRLTALIKFNQQLHEDATQTMQRYWREKLNTQNLFLTDGSGLARTNAISAKTLCELLTYMNSKNFIETLPIAGVSGTMKNIAKNQAAHNKIYAKSGSMRRVRAYAGYATIQNNKKIAFAFLVNNYTCTNKQVTQQIEKLMNALVK